VGGVAGKGLSGPGQDEEESLRVCECEWACVWEEVTVKVDDVELGDEMQDRTVAERR
jgi:hypothetical protein